MTVPRENGLAFFPRSVKVGNITLQPLTLAHVVALADLGVDIAKPITRETVFKSAFVLSCESRHSSPSGPRATAPSGPRPTAGGAFPTREDGSAMPSQFPRFLRRYKGGLQALANAVETVFNDAFETYVKPGAQSSSRTVSANPSGLGWPLEYADFLCAEYGWSFEDAINQPVSRVFALVAASRQRHGGKNGINYLEREYAKKLKHHG